MKVRVRHILLGLTLAILMGVAGCASEPIETSTLVCTPGERKCDATSTKILECHPNGAAWALVSYCSVDAFCVNGLCTGDGSTGFEGQGNPETSNSTTTEFEATVDAQESEDFDATDTLEEPDSTEEEDADTANEQETPDVSVTEGEEELPEQEGGGEGERERNEVIIYEEVFNADSAVPVTEVGSWSHHYCEDKWLMGAGLMSPQDNDLCSSEGECVMGFTLNISSNPESPSEACSDSPLNNFVTLSGAGTWYQFSYEAEFITWDNDAIGLVFGYKDPANFYVLSVSSDRNPVLDTEGLQYNGEPITLAEAEELAEAASDDNGFVSLIRVTGSFSEDFALTSELLAYSDLPEGAYTVGSNCTFVVDTFENSIDAWLRCGNGEWSPIVSYGFNDAETWQNSLTGTVGLYSYGMGLDDLSCLGGGGCGYERISLRAEPFSQN